MQENKKLNTRQWQVYNEIKKYPGISARTLATTLDYGIDDDAKLRNLSRASIDLYKDIEYINESPEIEKIIIWDTKSHYKIAENYEEVKNFVNRIYVKQALKKLYKSSNLLKKAKLDGQCKLISTKGDVIDENSKARPFVETFENKEIAVCVKEIDYGSN